MMENDPANLADYRREQRLRRRMTEQLLERGDRRRRDRPQDGHDE